MKKKSRQKAIELLKVHAILAKDNLARAYSLIHYYQFMFGKEGLKSLTATDILRAAVVFTHASLEDFLRSLAEQFLPFADKETLNKIPLIGNTNINRPEKFSLGKLAEYRGKTVDQVIKESVANHLEYSNYNNTTEIAQLLSSLSIDVSKVNSCFPALDELMKRRHQIVHRGDKIRNGKGKNRTEPINPTTVDKWICNIIKFVNSVLDELLKIHCSD